MPKHPHGYDRMHRWKEQRKPMPLGWAVLIVVGAALIIRAVA